MLLFALLVLVSAFPHNAERLLLIRVVLWQDTHCVRSTPCLDEHVIRLALLERCHFPLWLVQRFVALPPPLLDMHPDQRRSDYRLVVPQCLLVLLALRCLASCSSESLRRGRCLARFFALGIRLHSGQKFRIVLVYEELATDVNVLRTVLRCEEAQVV